MCVYGKCVSLILEGVRNVYTFHFRFVLPKLDCVYIIKWIYASYLYHTTN